MAVSLYTHKLFLLIQKDDMDDCRLPIVEAEKGDTVVINVRNQLDDWTTTLHAHGLYQNGTSYQDGGPGVSEW